MGVTARPAITIACQRIDPGARQPGPTAIRLTGRTAAPPSGQGSGTSWQNGTIQPNRLLVTGPPRPHAAPIRKSEP
jgi:hypothetical protein